VSKVYLNFGIPLVTEPPVLHVNGQTYVLALFHNYVTYT